VHLVPKGELVKIQVGFDDRVYGTATAGDDGSLTFDGPNKDGVENLVEGYAHQMLQGTIDGDADPTPEDVLKYTVEQLGQGGTRAWAEEVPEDDAETPAEDAAPGEEPDDTTSEDATNEEPQPAADPKAAA
jgi:hypothetical protein